MVNGRLILPEPNDSRFHSRIFQAQQAKKEVSITIDNNNHCLTLLIKQILTVYYCTENYPDWKPA